MCKMMKARRCGLVAFIRSKNSVSCLTLGCLSAFRSRGKLHPEGGQGAGQSDGPEHSQVKVHRLPAGQPGRLHQSTEARRLQPHLRQQ